MEKWIEVPLVEKELVILHLLECASEMYRRSQSADHFALPQAFQRQNLAYEAFRASARLLGCEEFPGEPPLPPWSESEQSMKEIVLLNLHDWQTSWMDSLQEATEAGFKARAARCDCMVRAVGIALTELLAPTGIPMTGIEPLEKN